MSIVVKICLMLIKQSFKYELKPNNKQEIYCSKPIEKLMK
jgi:hypothetical protein